MTNTNIYGICEKLEHRLNAERISASVYPASPNLPVICVEISWGDWKHDHLRAKWFISENYPGIKFFDSCVTEEDGSDTYSAIHRFIVA